jgi:hypothetical protein
LDLPDARSFGSVVLILGVEIDRNGAISVDGTTLLHDRELVERVRAALQRAPELRVVLHAEKGVAFEHVIKALDLVKQGGAKYVAFGVAPIAGGELGSVVTGSVGAPSAQVTANAWDCPFPKEADEAAVDSAVVILRVSVAASGAPESVEVLSDPGNGFGDAARQCAMARTYQPAHDPSGHTVAAKTKPIRVRYVR